MARLLEMDGDGPNALVSVASYRYDAQGRRVEYIDATRSVTVRYAYDGANAIVEYEYDSTSLTGTRSYVHGTQYIDERAVMREDL
jgi:YD repeat-containing protein